MSKLDQDFGTLSDLIGSYAAEAPDRLALVHGDERVTYRELDAMMDRVAAGLQRDGCPRSASVAICAATSIPYAFTFLGALRGGYPVAPLATSATGDSLAGMVADSEAAALFVDSEVGRALDTAERSLLVPRVALDGSAAGVPFEAWLPAPGSRPADVNVAPEDPFNIIYSSGTTGTPKGIVQSHAMRWQHIHRGPLFGYTGEAVTLVSTPLYSNTTLVSFLPALAGGGTVVLMEKFDVARFLALAEQHRVTHAMLVPVQYRRLMSDPEFDRHDLSRFQMKFSTSAPFSAELKADVLRRWPGGLVEYYGMTEGGGSCILRAHEHPDKLHTVGQPADGHEILLIDDDGHPVEPGRAGEVVGRSAAIMDGYKGQPRKTAEAEWRDAAGNRFIRTGDIGRFDEQGFLTLLDRKKDMIISGGFNIYPSDLEAVLVTHDAVAEASVVGVPSEQWGETPIGFVALAPGRQANPESIREWANSRVGKIQRLTEVCVVPSLPRSSIGKVLKRELRDRYLLHQAEHSPAHSRP